MLPNPLDHVRREADRMRDQAADVAPRLMFVNGFAAGLVTLQDAEGNAGEDVAWIGAYPPQVGDAVLVHTIPGRGHRHAASSRVAIGPISRNASDVGAIVTGADAQNSSDVTSTTSTVTFSDAMVLTLALGAGLWSIAAIGNVFMRHSTAGAVDVRLEINGVGVSPAITQSVVSSGFDRIGVAKKVSGIVVPSGGANVTVRIQFKANAAGTATCDQPALMATARRG